MFLDVAEVIFLSSPLISQPEFSAKIFTYLSKFVKRIYSPKLLSSNPVYLTSQLSTISDLVFISFILEFNKVTDFIILC